MNDRFKPKWAIGISRNMQSVRRSIIYPEKFTLKNAVFQPIACQVVSMRKVSSVAVLYFDKIKFETLNEIKNLNINNIDDYKYAIDILKTK